jgi:DMSO reductase anchor subunit
MTAKSERLDRVSTSLFSLVLVGTAIKLVLEGCVLFHRRDHRHSTRKRMALVMLGELRTATKVRFGSSLVGGLAVPLVFLLHGFEGRAAAPGKVLMLFLLVTGEVAERYLFFRAAPTSRMPGGLQ